MRKEMINHSFIAIMTVIFFSFIYISLIIFKPIDAWGG